MRTHIQKVKIREMSVRDGLQNEKKIIPTANKIELINDLIDAGIQYIEATAFVSPKAIPQMADAVELAQQLSHSKPITFSALVPNMKGFENAVNAFRFEEIAVFTAASETFNQHNINATIDESFERFEPVIKAARERKIRVRGYVSTAFVCPYEGKINPTATMSVIERLFDMGCYEVSVGDTIGKATPDDVDVLLERVEKNGWIPKIAGHFHDTFGTALANVLQSLKWGISIFDSSAGGIGGCPYAPGASGNVATEDLVFHLDQLGIETGINLKKLIEASKKVEALLDHPLPSKVYKALRG